MDFLDPKKSRAQEIRLLVGYALIGIAIMLSMVVFAYIWQGYWLDKGKVIQNGLVFVSSHPGGASISLNGRQTATTNARLTLPAGTYTMEIIRSGYRTWQRAVTVEGGQVERFDYPFLLPSSLTTTNLQSFAARPDQATTQSPNRRWLLIESATALGNFTLYDLTKPTQVAVTVNVPAGVLTAPTTKAPQQLSVVDWSDDNQHVLLKHSYDKKYEYILLDTKNPANSLNLNKTLKTAPTLLTLQNKQYDHYFVYNGVTQNLSTASLSNPVPVLLLEHVITYATYGTNVVLYTTAQNTPAGQTAVILYQNNTNYLVRYISQSPIYLLNLTQYSGSWYIAAGSSSENRVYVYQNPLDVLSAHTDTVLVPVAVLKLDKPNYISFSASAQFIMAENADSFAVYDVQYDKTYAYKVDAPFDKPQMHANWMDGDRLDYVSGGKLIIFDYDDIYKQTLMSASPAYVPFFDTNYKYVYTLAPVTAAPKTPAGNVVLTSTALLTPTDL